MAHKKKKAPQPAPAPPKSKFRKGLWLAVWGSVCLYFSAWTFIFLARGVPGLALVHFIGALFGFLIALMALQPDKL